MLVTMLVRADRPTVALIVALAGACAHPTTAPREARELRVCGGEMSSAAEVCACLIAHVKTTPAGEDRELTCSDGTVHAQTADLPLSVVLIAGARQPLAYLVHTPPTGARRVLAAVPGQPGMKFDSAVTSAFPTRAGYAPGPATEWHGGRRLIQVTTKWTDGVSRVSGTGVANPSRQAAHEHAPN